MQYLKYELSDILPDYHAIMWDTVSWLANVAWSQGLKSWLPQMGFPWWHNSDGGVSARCAYCEAELADSKPNSIPHPFHIRVHGEVRSWKIVCRIFLKRTMMRSLQFILMGLKWHTTEGRRTRRHSLHSYVLVTLSATFLIVDSYCS